MPSSYVSNHVHIVFSTKNRLKVIPEDLQPKLWAYMPGIATIHSMHAVAIGGSILSTHLSLCDKPRLTHTKDKLYLSRDRKLQA